MADTSEIRLRLTPEQRRIVEQLAKRDRVSADEAILRAVQQALAREASAFPQGTPFHGFDGALAALGEGPADLSTNRDHLEDLGR